MQALIAYSPGRVKMNLFVIDPESFRIIDADRYQAQCQEDIRAWCNDGDWEADTDWPTLLRQLSTAMVALERAVDSPTVEPADLGTLATQEMGTCVGLAAVVLKRLGVPTGHALSAYSKQGSAVAGFCVARLMMPQGLTPGETEVMWRLVHSFTDDECADVVVQTAAGLSLLGFSSSEVLTIRGESTVDAES